MQICETTTVEKEKNHHQESESDRKKPIFTNIETEHPEC